jgi:hypothetical protein
MSDSSHSDITFRDLALPDFLLAALDTVGYESPTPIQAQTIPHLLQGLDLLGHAPTGTGKTAAFALPLLARLDMDQPSVQIMVLTPTRELAIQVAEAFQSYASGIKGFHVLPIYGGQDYSGQIRQLKRGVHAVVGTPGRVMDHIIEQAITQVSQLRGRLGAFERNTLETNVRSLQTSLENSTAAESRIRDADFAEEISKLTRAQVLTSVGTSVLSQANNSAANVLSLLQ